MKGIEHRIQGTIHDIFDLKNSSLRDRTDPEYAMAEIAFEAVTKLFMARILGDEIDKVNDYQIEVIVRIKDIPSKDK